MLGKRKNEIIAYCLVGIACGAILGIFNQFEKIFGIISGFLLGAYLGVASTTFFENWSRKSLLKNLFLVAISGTLGILGLGTYLGIAYGLVAVGWFLLNTNKLTGPMIKWFPGTMAKSLGTLVTPLALGVLQWIFFRKSKNVESELIQDIKGLIAVSMMGCLIGGVISSLLFIFIFPTVWIIGHIPNDVVGGGLFGGFFGGLFGALFGRVFKSLINLW